MRAVLLRASRLLLRVVMIDHIEVRASGLPFSLQRGGLSFSAVREILSEVDLLAGFTLC